jgi:hypothetical protein
MCWSGGSPSWHDFYHRWQNRTRSSTPADLSLLGVKQNTKIHCEFFAFCRVDAGNFHRKLSQIALYNLAIIWLVPPLEACRIPLNISFSPLPVDPSQMAMACSLRSTGIGQRGVFARVPLPRHDVDIA